MCVVAATNGDFPADSRKFSHTPRYPYRYRYGSPSILCRDDKARGDSAATYGHRYGICVRRRPQRGKQTELEKRNKTLPATVWRTCDTRGWSSGSSPRIRLIDQATPPRRRRLCPEASPGRRCRQGSFPGSLGRSRGPGPDPASARSTGSLLVVNYSIIIPSATRRVLLRLPVQFNNFQRSRGAARVSLGGPGLSLLSHEVYALKANPCCRLEGAHPLAARLEVSKRTPVPRLHSCQGLQSGGGWSQGTVCVPVP